MSINSCFIGAHQKTCFLGATSNSCYLSAGMHMSEGMCPKSIKATGTQPLALRKGSFSMHQ